MTLAPFSESILEFSSAESEFFHERRSSHFQGPQQACHTEHLELTLIVGGSEFLAQGGGMDHLRAGRYALIAPGTEHSSWTKSTAVEEIIVHIPTQTIAKTADELNVSSISWTSGSFPALSAVGERVSALHTVLVQSEENTLAIQAMNIRLIATLLHVHMNAPVKQSGATKACLQEAADWLRSDLAITPKLEELADATGLSRYHFLREFKLVFGLPPHAYLTRERLNAACQRLLQDNDSITEIALQLGFGSSSRFGQLFRKHFGVSPSTWKRQYKC